MIALFVKNDFGLKCFRPPIIVVQLGSHFFWMKNWYSTSCEKSEGSGHSNRYMCTSSVSQSCGAIRGDRDEAFVKWIM